MPRVTYFDIAAKNPARAKAFYQKVFGWKFRKWDGPSPYWLISTGKGPGIDGGMGLREESSAPAMNTVEVHSIDEYAARIRANGGKVLMRKTAIPGVGWFTSMQDTEGNRFGLMEPDTKAQ